jgi:hypothetical protein
VGVVVVVVVVVVLMIVVPLVLLPWKERNHECELEVLAIITKNNRMKGRFVRTRFSELSNKRFEAIHHVPLEYGNC